MEFTCPQYYLLSPFVQSVLMMADDYKQNRLGPVTDLPSPLAAYLRIASAELAEFNTFWESQLMPAPKGK